MKRTVDEILLSILKNLKFITGFTFIVVTVVVVYSFIVPPRYTATSIIMPKRIEFFHPDSITVTRMKLPVPSEYYFLPSLMTPSHLYAEILKTPRVIYPVIKRYNLQEYFKEKTLKETRDELLKHIHIKISESGLIYFSVELKNRKLATDVNNAMIEELQNAVNSLDQGVWNRLSLFLLGKLKELDDSVSTLEHRLAAFRRTYTTLYPDEEYEKTLSTYFSLVYQKLQYEFQFEYLKSFMDSTSYISLLENRLKILQARLREFISGEKNQWVSKSPVKFSKLISEYNRLNMELEAVQSLREAIFYEYEYARIMAERAYPPIEVLEPASIPEIRSFPKRKRLVILALIFGIYMGIVLSFFLEYVNEIKSDPERKRKWEEVLKRLKILKL